jgi:hypothetical protein
MTAGVPISGDVRKSRAPGGFHRTSAFDGSRVEEKKIVVCAGTFRAEDAKEPFDGLDEADAAFVKGMLSREFREEMPNLPAGGPKESAVRRNAHEDLGNRQRDDLRIACLAPGVPLPLWQKIIGCAINERAEGVEVGVHRGLQADGENDTVGFGPSASNPFFGVTFVASII